jgi:hypothetical protein
LSQKALRASWEMLASRRHRAAITASPLPGSSWKALLRTLTDDMERAKMAEARDVRVRPG